MAANKEPAPQARGNPRASRAQCTQRYRRDVPEGFRMVLRPGDPSSPVIDMSTGELLSKGRS